MARFCNGEIDAADAANGASHSAVDVLRSGFDPIVLEDARGEDECDDGHALAEAGDAEALMRWLVAPADLDDFMRHTWERRAMYVSRNENKNYYAGLLSKAIIDEWLKAGEDALRRQRRRGELRERDVAARTT